MSASLTAEVLQDDLALSLAGVIAAANKKARELGVDVPRSFISITQNPDHQRTLWRINYGPKDYRNRRGGDLLIEVDAAGFGIVGTWRGQ